MQPIKQAQLLLEKSGEEVGANFTQIVVADIEYLLSSKDIHIVKKTLENFERKLSFGKGLTAEQEEPSSMPKSRLPPTF